MSMGSDEEFAEEFAKYDAQLRGGQMHAILLAQTLCYALTASGTLAAADLLADFDRNLNQLEDYLADPDPEKEFQAATSVHHQRLELFRSQYRAWAIHHGFLKADPEDPPPDNLLPFPGHG